MTNLFGIPALNRDELYLLFGLGWRIVPTPGVCAIRNLFHNAESERLNLYYSDQIR
jgi:hypothetical protein